MIQEFTILTHAFDFLQLPYTSSIIIIIIIICMHMMSMTYAYYSSKSVPTLYLWAPNS